MQPVTTRMMRGARVFVLSLAASAAMAASLAGQSVVDRPPNLSGAWLGESGTIQFNFLHRFSVARAPSRKVSNSPTFVVAYRLPLPLLIGLTYATSSDITPQFPNEYEVFARFRPLAADHGAPLDLAAQLGYNQAAESMDGELTAARSLGRLRIMAAGRYFSDGYGRGEARYAVGGGATLRLHRNVSLAGDVTTLLDRLAGEDVAWGAALQLAIPSTPHTLSLQVTNTTTGTLQGSSRGLGDMRGGFEFTIPITLGRYFGRRSAAAAATVTPSAPADSSQVPVDMRAIVFAPASLEIPAGGGIAFTNQDPLVHTITADDGSWDSGPIQPGATWRRVFDRPGTYAFHCTPHPFMKGVVVVR